METLAEACGWPHDATPKAAEAISPYSAVMLRGFLHVLLTSVYILLSGDVVRLLLLNDTVWNERAKKLSQGLYILLCFLPPVFLSPIPAAVDTDPVLLPNRQQERQSQPPAEQHVSVQQPPPQQETQEMGRRQQQSRVQPLQQSQPPHLEQLQPQRQSEDQPHAPLQHLQPQRQREEEKRQHQPFPSQQLASRQEEEEQQQRSQPTQRATTGGAPPAPWSLPTAVPSKCTAARCPALTTGDSSKLVGMACATAAVVVVSLKHAVAPAALGRKGGGRALRVKIPVTTAASALAAAAAFFCAAPLFVAAQHFTAPAPAVDPASLTPFGVTPAEPGSAAATAALAASAADALQRLRHLDLLRAAAPSGVILLSQDSYNSLFLGSLPPPLPPAAGSRHSSASAESAAAAAAPETAAEEAARRRKRRSLYFATWKRAPPRPFHLFVLFTFLVPDEVQQRLPYTKCPECADAYRAFDRIGQAYKQVEEKKPTRRSWWSTPRGKREGSNQLSASPVSSEDEAPVFFAVANVALLTHAHAYHGLQSLPAIVYVPFAQQQKNQQQLQQQMQEQRIQMKKKGRRQQEQLPTESRHYGGEEEGDEEEAEDDGDVDLFENEAEMAGNVVDPVKRMQAAAPSPFPRSDLLMLQRATADAGIERAILEWVNMKTKWGVDLPSSVWTDGRSLCVLMALLVLLLLLARLLVSLLPRYPWLLPAAACVFYWLSTSGLVFSLYNRVPLYGLDTQTGRRVFITPGRNQFFLEGFLMSGCSVLVAAAGTALIYLPHSLRLYSRGAATAAAGYRRRALQTLLDFLDADKESRCSSHSGSAGHSQRHSTSHAQRKRRNTCSSSGFQTGKLSDGDVQGALRHRSVRASANRSGKSKRVTGAQCSSSGGTVLHMPTAGVDPVEQGSAAGVAVEEKGEHHNYADETEFDELLLGVVEAEQRERCLRIRSGLQASERICLTILLVVCSLIFIGAASVELQGFRYKSPWYRASFFPAPDYLRGPMRIDRGNAF